MILRKILAAGVLLLSCLFLSIGCNGHYVQATGPSFDMTGQSPDYFPLNEGHSTTYEIDNGYGPVQTVSFTVGKQVSFHTGTATEWISNSNGVKDTGYFVYANNSLLYYDGKKAKPEIILTEPLTIGSSWSRISNDGTNQLNDTVTIDVQDKGGDSTGNNEGIQLVSFPTDGSEMMTVDKIESVDLGRAGYFSKVVRVSNDAGNGAKNFYWYAAGVGMIKYVLGASDSEDPQGSVEGILVSYGGGK